MAAATNVPIIQIAPTTINNNPYIVALGDDGGVYVMNLTIATNKELDTSWQQLPPINIPNGYTYPEVTDGSGDLLANVKPLIYTPTNNS